MKFSIRALLALTAFVALLVAIVFTFPDWLASLLLMLLLPMMIGVLVTSVFYARGDLRAFSVATLAVMAPMVSAFAVMVVFEFGIEVYESPLDVASIKETLRKFAYFVKIITLLASVTTFPAGLTGVVVRRLLVAGQNESRSATPD